MRRTRETREVIPGAAAKLDIPVQRPSVVGYPVRIMLRTMRCAGFESFSELLQPAGLYQLEGQSLSPTGNEVAQRLRSPSAWPSATRDRVRRSRQRNFLRLSHGNQRSIAGSTEPWRVFALAGIDT